MAWKALSWVREAQEKNATILFQDESSVEMGHNVRKTQSPKGEEWSIRYSNFTVNAGTVQNVIAVYFIGFTKALQKDYISIFYVGEPDAT